MKYSGQSRIHNIQRKQIMNYTIDITKAVSKEAEEAFMDNYFGLSIYADESAYRHIFFMAVEGHRRLKPYLNRCKDNNKDDYFYKEMLSLCMGRIQKKLMLTYDDYKNEEKKALETAKFIWESIEPLASFSPIELKILFDMFLAPHASKK